MFLISSAEMSLRRHAHAMLTFVLLDMFIMHILFDLCQTRKEHKPYPNEIIYILLKKQSCNKCVLMLSLGSSLNIEENILFRNI